MVISTQWIDRVCVNGYVDSGLIECVVYNEIVLISIGCIN